MHRRLAVPMLPLRVWVHCPRASNGLLPPRSNPVGYVRWYARSDSVLLFLLQTIIPTVFRSQVGKPYLGTSGLPVIRPQSVASANESERKARSYCNNAYSAFACFKIGTSGSASFQSVMKS